MPFLDEIKISAKAGDGGDGVVRWRKEKNREFGGPSGGNGGQGGNVYALTIRDIYVLSKYKVNKLFLAERGKDGAKNSLHGANGKDLDILLPIGSIIENLGTGEKISLEKDGERILLLSGGYGGRGNEAFKRSTRQRPSEAEDGKPGEEAEFYIELELVADVGFIGLPNAGKTSLLNELTRAGAKVGHYPFTTLEPNLGEYHGYIISDIPGLIEGAAKGKGLGHKFLRHIKRTEKLVHLVSLENSAPIKAYKTIRKELARYNKDLLDKEEIIVLTKTDLVDDKEKIKKLVEKMKKFSPTVLTVSIHDTAALKKFQDTVFK